MAITFNDNGQIINSNPSQNANVTFGPNGEVIPNGQIAGTSIPQPTPMTSPAPTPTITPTIGPTPDVNNQAPVVPPVSTDSNTYSYIGSNGQPSTYQPSTYQPPQETIPLGSMSRPGNQTMPDSLLRWASNLSSNPIQQVDYLNKTAGKRYDFALNSNNDVVYSGDGKKTWNLFQTTTPFTSANPLDPKEYWNSIIQKEPELTEMAGMGVGGALGAASGFLGGGPLGSVPGATLGAGIGGGLANTANQFIASKMGVAPISNYANPNDTPQQQALEEAAGVGKQAGIHGTMDALGELGGRLLIPPAIGLARGTLGLDDSGAIAGLKAGWKNAVNAPATNPTDIPIIGWAIKTLTGEGLPAQSMKMQNQNYVKGVLGNLDTDLTSVPADIPPTPAFEELPPNATSSQLQVSLKDAVAQDAQTAKDYFNGAYDELKNGGQGYLLSDGSPGLNDIPLNKQALISDLQTLDIRTPEGKAALADVIQKINADNSSTLGDFLNTKSSLKGDLQPGNPQAYGAKKINADTSAIASQLESSYKSQIPDGELGTAYAETNANNAITQNTLNKIQALISQGKDFSGLMTGKMMAGMPNLLQNLEKGTAQDYMDPNGLMQNTINTYKRYLGAKIKESAMPSVQTSESPINWTNLNQTSTNPKGLDYFERMLAVNGKNPDLVENLENVRNISSNPDLFPSQIPKKPVDTGDIQWLMNLLNKVSLKPTIGMARGALMQPFYDPYGFAGRTALGQIYSKALSPQTGNQ